jgi:DNA/RNA endonuclease YhcR with UshA esterase domain
MKLIQVIKYSLILCITGLITSCMGSDYAAPDIDPANPPYGNNDLKETQVLTIRQLKDQYKTVINNSAYTQINNDVQIKGIVTGNDDQGNIYQEISVQDSTGALIVSINAGGLHGFLAVGQEILINLKDLYIGGYGQQCEVGGVYTNASTGAKSIGRMDRYTWENHVKLLGKVDASQATDLTEDFDASKIKDANYLIDNSGKLMTIHGVTIADADGKAVYAPNDGSVALTSNAVNRPFSEYSSQNLVLRTSTYADFANAAMPTGKVDITGIFTRFKNTWQILLRSTNDITPAK